MNLSKSPYRGTRDFFPQLKRERDFLFKAMEDTAHCFGYESYDGPLLEEVELYKAKSGEELINDQIYSFEDRGERFVAIRPEMTPTLARMVAQVHREVPKPIRWFSIPNLMRYEKPQRGRLREHWQFNCDIFGAPDGYGEAEVLSVLVNLFQRLGAGPEHYCILINDRRIVDELFKNHLKLEDSVIYKLYKIIDRSKKVSAEALEKMIGELALSTEQEAVFKSYIELSCFDDLFALLKTLNLAESAAPFEEFLTIARSFGLEPYLKFDPTIVRGLDYYTGIVFEAFDLHPDNRRALCGGGSYSGLLSLFNEEPLHGVGLGFGDVTVTDFLKTHNLMPDFKTPVNELFMAAQTPEGLNDLLSLASRLRQKGLRVVTALEPIKFKKVFNSAQKVGARAVILMGSDEIDKGEVQLKILSTGDQHNIKVNEIDAIYALVKES